MLSKIDDLLPQKTITEIHRILKDAAFIDGKLSAGLAANGVKNNEELDSRSETYRHLNELIMGRLVRHPRYSAVCWPKKIGSPIYARYQPGMTYGDHVDDPVMGHSSDYYRSDISMTIFLSQKEDYEGGELVIMSDYGEQRIKLDAGSVVFYPSSSRHYVAPVTSGERIVAVTWLQSTIRDPHQREILDQLNTARETLIHEQPESETTRQINAAFNNLVRRWIDV